MSKGRLSQKDNSFGCTIRSHSYDSAIENSIDFGLVHTGSTGFLQTLWLNCNTLSLKRKRLYISIVSFLVRQLYLLKVWSHPPLHLQKRWNGKLRHKHLPTDADRWGNVNHRLDCMTISSLFTHFVARHLDWHIRPLGQANPPFGGPQILQGVRVIYRLTLLIVYSVLMYLDQALGPDQFTLGRPKQLLGAWVINLLYIHAIATLYLHVIATQYL